MSFILDALKKSEAERQRQAGPTLLEVRVGRPRRRYPIWAAVVGALLAANAIVLVVFVLRRPPAELPPAQAATALAPAADGAPPPAARSAPAASSAAVRGTPASSVSPSAATAERPGAVPNAAGVVRNPADDEPALAAGSMQVDHAGAENYANLPNITQIAGNVPPLRLDLLDYSERPGERYALINMRRVREGDVLQEGPQVLAIRRDGVALTYQGQDFMLRPNAQ